ncbi:hypothetical protein HMPREF3291_05500 [Bacillus sp. HMSC76G11]|nr:hypothetical protein HMPREF3291_05500 [Bacillus sp. HMSC76G11]
MKKHRVIKMFYLSLVQTLILFLLAGCWSYNTIEDLNFVAGASLDSGEDGKIKSTLQLILPQSNNKGQNTGGGSQKPYINVSATGDSLEPIGWDTTLTREGIIFGAHEKVVIISEDLARYNSIRQLIDLYYRDIDIRGNTLIFIANGRADETLDLQEPNIIPAFRILEIANQQLTTKVPKPTSLINILSKMEADSSFLIQRIVSAEGDVNFDGAAVIHGKTNKLIGYFNKEELEGFNWLTGESKGGSVKAQTKEPVQYQVESMESKIEPIVKGNQILFKVKIETEGRIAENWKKSYRLFQNKDVKQLEKEIEKEIKGLVGNTIKKMQEEYEVDVGGFGNRLRIKYPKVWARMKDDWDEKFSTTPIHYSVKVVIKDYGMIGSD